MAEDVPKDFRSDEDFAVDAAILAVAVALMAADGKKLPSLTDMKRRIQENPEKMGEHLSAMLDTIGAACDQAVFLFGLMRETIRKTRTETPIFPPLGGSA